MVKNSIGFMLLGAGLEEAFSTHKNNPLT